MTILITLGVLLALILIIAPVRQFVFNMIAVAILGITWVVQQVFRRTPPGWLVRAYNWARGRSGRIAGYIGWGLVALTLLLALGVASRNMEFLTVLFTLLGAAVFLFFRFFNAIQRKWGVTTGVTQTLGIWAMGLFFLALLALGGADLMGGLGIRNLVLLSLMVMVFSIGFTLAGTRKAIAAGTAGIPAATLRSDFGRKAMMWGSLLIVLAVLIPRMFFTVYHHNPLLLGSRKVVAAFGERGARELLEKADEVEPNSPIELQKLNEDLRRVVIRNDLERHGAHLARLKHISQSRRLTEAEIREVRDASQAIIRLQKELKDLDRDPGETRVRSSVSSFPLWFWALILLPGVWAVTSIVKRQWFQAAAALTIILLLYQGAQTAQAATYLPQPRFSSPTATQPAAAITGEPLSLPADAQPLVERYARQHGVPYNFMAAVCLRESECQLNVRDGDDGEVCAMQIKPQTAKVDGGLSGTEAEIVKQLRDPQTCFETSARILAKYQADPQIGSDYELLALAYNAGPEAARERRYPGRSREYVSSVIARARGARQPAVQLAAAQSEPDAWIINHTRRPIFVKFDGSRRERIRPTYGVRWTKGLPNSAVVLDEGGNELDRINRPGPDQDRKVYIRS